MLQNAVAVFPLPLNLTITLDLAPDATVLAFTCGISVLTGALVGLVPALQSTCSDVVTTLKQDTAGGGQSGQLRWRNALIVTQLTLSLVLLVGAGLFLRSFQQLTAIDPGVRRRANGPDGRLDSKHGDSRRTKAGSTPVDSSSGSEGCQVPMPLA